MKAWSPQINQSTLCAIEQKHYHGPHPTRISSWQCIEPEPRKPRHHEDPTACKWHTCEGLEKVKSFLHLKPTLKTPTNFFALLHWSIPSQNYLTNTSSWRCSSQRAGKEKRGHRFFGPGLQPKSLTSTLQVLPDLALQVKRGQGTIPGLQRHSEAGPSLCTGFMVVSSKDLESWLSYKSTFPNSSSCPKLMGNWSKAAAGLGHLPLGIEKIMCLVSNKIECKKHLTWCRSNTDFTGYFLPEASFQQFIPLLSSNLKLLRSSL